MLDTDTFQVAPELPAKAELISNAGDPSVMIYSRKGKNCCAAAEKGVRTSMIDNIADAQVSEEERELVNRAACGEDHGDKVHLLQPMQDHVRVDVHTAAHRGPHSRAGHVRILNSLN